MGELTLAESFLGFEPRLAVFQVKVGLNGGEI